jgi:hypothetical protein
LEIERIPSREGRGLELDAVSSDACLLVSLSCFLLRGTYALDTTHIIYHTKQDSPFPPQASGRNLLAIQSRTLPFLPKHREIL